MCSQLHLLVSTSRRLRLDQAPVLGHDHRLVRCRVRRHQQPHQHHEHPHLFPGAPQRSHGTADQLCWHPNAKHHHLRADRLHRELDNRRYHHRVPPQIHHLQLRIHVVGQACNDSRRSFSLLNRALLLHPHNNLPKHQHKAELDRHVYRICHCCIRGLRPLRHAPAPWRGAARPRSRRPRRARLGLGPRDTARPRPWHSRAIRRGCRPSNLHGRQCAAHRARIRGYNLHAGARRLPILNPVPDPHLDRARRQRPVHLSNRLADHIRRTVAITLRHRRRTVPLGNAHQQDHRPGRVPASQPKPIRSGVEAPVATVGGVTVSEGNGGGAVVVGGQTVSPGESVTLSGGQVVGVTTVDGGATQVVVDGSTTTLPSLSAVTTVAGQTIGVGGDGGVLVGGQTLTPGETLTLPNGDLAGVQTGSNGVTEVAIDGSTAVLTSTGSGLGGLIWSGIGATGSGSATRTTASTAEETGLQTTAASSGSTGGASSSPSADGAACLQRDSVVVWMVLVSSVVMLGA
ncbi:hypothetical protein B0J12DRAFT_413779 [Macrophomina phaseolina]|uniref:Uncharacterized protein n=1 Tax=Macrophomina phaseolina TaxID=35725 RepID=A0ABQ8GM40_9PEZI|nr:hypothetical protein B0J12DRAFT_413779 [Macrophomina phaseolina]